MAHKIVVHLIVVYIFVLINVVLNSIAYLKKKKRPLIMKVNVLVTELGGEGEVGFERKLPPSTCTVSHCTDVYLLPLWIKVTC